MLTGDLVRHTIDDTNIAPLFISRKDGPRYIRICRKLIDIFTQHVGKRRGELSEDLEAFESTSTDFKIYRGFAKLLLDRCTFAPPWEGDYARLRRRVFERAQRAYPIVLEPDLLHQTTNEAVLKDVADELGEPPEKLDDVLYGDLSENHILVGLEGKITPEDLLRRYNLALAQGIL